MMIAAMTITMGAANASLRRNARSWAAPFASHAAHRCSKLVPDSVTAEVDGCGLELHECSQQNSGSWRRTIQSDLMKTTYVNTTIAALSMMTAGAFGLLAPVTTPSGWFMLAAAATAPSLVFMHYFKRPAETMSESIREAIR